MTRFTGRFLPRLPTSVAGPSAVSASRFRNTTTSSELSAGWHRPRLHSKTGDLNSGFSDSRPILWRVPACRSGGAERIRYRGMGFITPSSTGRASRPNQAAAVRWEPYSAIRTGEASAILSNGRRTNSQLTAAPIHERSTGKPDAASRNASTRSYRGRIARETAPRERLVDATTDDATPARAKPIAGRLKREKRIRSSAANPGPNRYSTDRPTDTAYRVAFESPLAHTGYSGPYSTSTSVS